MFKLIVLELSFALLYVIQTPCFAQAPRPLSVGDLIENAKLEHVNKASGVTTSNAGNLYKSLSLKDSFKPASGSTEPLLWSITGINQHLVAEVFYQGRVHVLHLFDNERSIGPWQVERYSSHGLLLTQPNKHGKNNALQSLFLSSPRPGGSIANFGFLAETNLSSLQAAAQLPLPATSTAPALDASLKPASLAGTLK